MNSRCSNRKLKPQPQNTTPPTQACVPTPSLSFVEMDWQGLRSMWMSMVLGAFAFVRHDGCPSGFRAVHGM